MVAVEERALVWVAVLEAHLGEHPRDGPTLPAIVALGPAVVGQRLLRIDVL